MKKILFTLAVVSTLSMGGCAPLLFAGAGAAGYAGWRWEFKTCVAIDGRSVSRHWAHLHPNLARCVR